MIVLSCVDVSYAKTINIAQVAMNPLVSSLKLLLHLKVALAKKAAALKNIVNVMQIN